MQRSRLASFLILTVIAAVGVAELAACTPKATIQRTTPVADLRVYRAVMVRGASTTTQWMGQDLATRTARFLQEQCQFDGVFIGAANAQPRPEQSIDLIVDINVLKAVRGTGTIIRNPNQAEVDVSMVLSDGLSDELLGSASIRGSSSAVKVGGNESPEVQALEVVAEQIGRILAKSGCGGERLARVEPEPEPDVPPEPIDPGTTPDQLAEADRINDEGKQMFRDGKVAGARARFEQAIEINADPKYVMNLCLAFEALEKYKEAIAACERVITSNPEKRLVEKAEQRIEYIREKQ